MLTVKQLADIKGVSPQRILQLIREHRIDAEKFGSQWAIKSEVVKPPRKKFPKPKNKVIKIY